MLISSFLLINIDVIIFTNPLKAVFTRISGISTVGILNNKNELITYQYCSNKNKLRIMFIIKYLVFKYIYVGKWEIIRYVLDSNAVNETYIISQLIKHMYRMHDFKHL